MKIRSRDGSEIIEKRSARSILDDQSPAARIEMLMLLRHPTDEEGNSLEPIIDEATFRHLLDFPC